MQRKSPAVGGWVISLMAIFWKRVGLASQAVATVVRRLRSTLAAVQPQRLATSR